MADVFISYSRRDQEFVRQLAAALTDAERQAWVDWEGIPLTADWWEEIQRGIEAADTFVFIISPDSVASKVCNMEIEHAISHNKRLVPIMRREAIPEQMHRALAQHNWLYARDDDDFQAVFDQLIDALNTDLDYVRAHTRLLLRAREWQDKDRNLSFVLRGDELTGAESWLAQSGGKEPKPTEMQTNYILASRRGANARQRSLLAGVSVALALTLVLALVSAALFTVAESRRQESDQRGTAVADQASTATHALGLSEVRGTAVAEQAATSTNALGLSEVRGTEAAVQAVTAVAAEATSARRAVEWQGLAWSVASERAQAAQEGDLALALALHANAIDAPPPEVRAQLLNAAYGPGTANVYAGEHEYWITSIARSADGQFLLSTAQDGDLVLWDAESGAVIRRENLSEAQPVGGGAALAMEGVNAIAFHPTDPALAALGFNTGAIALFNVKTWTIVEETSPMAHIINTIAFSPDGSRLAVGLNDDRDTFQIFDGVSLKRVAAPQDHEAPVRSVAFSADSAFLLTASEDATVRLWTADGDPVRTFGPIEDENEPAPYVIGAYFNGGTVIAATNAGQIVSLDLETGEELLRYDTGFTPTYIGDIALSPDGQILATGGTDGLLYLWNTRDGRLARVLRGHTLRIDDVAFGGNGIDLFTASQDLTVRHWYARSGAETRRSFGFSVNGSASRSTLSADGTRAVTIGGQNDPSVLVWDLATGDLLHRLEGHTDAVVSADLQTIDGQLHALTSAWDGTVRLWNIDSGELVTTLEIGGLLLPSVDFTPDGTGALVTYFGEDFNATTYLALYDLATGEEVRRYDAEMSVYVQARYTPDGTQIAVGGADQAGSGRLVLLDAATGEVAHTFPSAFNSAVQFISFSPEGERMVASGQDGLIVEYDLASGRELRRYVGHTDVVNEARISPDGRLIASASYDDTIRLWDTTTGVEVLRLAADSDARGVSFAADSTSERATLYVSTQDGAFTRYDLDFEVGAITAWARDHRNVRDFTCAERAANRIAPLCE